MSDNTKKEYRLRPGCSFGMRKQYKGGTAKDKVRLTGAEYSGVMHLFYVEDEKPKNGKREFDPEMPIEEMTAGEMKQLIEWQFVSPKPKSTEEIRAAIIEVREQNKNEDSEE